MKCKVISVLAIIGMLNLTSCMQDHPSPSDVQNEIKVSAAIEGAANSTVKTRVTNNSWNDGDAIGIFMKNSGSTLSTSSLAVNAKYVTNGGGNFSPTLTNEIHFPFNDDKVDFIAYYPYTNPLDGLNYLVDVSDQSSLSNIDLLYSNNAKGLNASYGNVELNFKHQLSNVILNISMADKPDYDLTGLTAEITNVYTKASFSLVNGTISNENEIKNVSFKVNVDGKSAQAILLPTTSLDSMILVLTLDCISYSFNLAISKEISSFDKSTKHILNVTLKPGDDPKIESVTATIEDWIDGTTVDVIADEDSSYTTPENSSGESGEGDGNGEGEETGDGNDLEEGNGSEERPYTVTQAKERPLNETIWVKGYIVGYYESASESTFRATNINVINQNNVAIAFSATESESQKTLRIDMNAGADIDVKSYSNLKDKPENFGKEAFFYGSIGENTKDIVVLTNVRKLIIDGEQYGDK